MHVPFCARRCDYCAFATWTDRHHLMADYVAACVDDLTEQLGGVEPAGSVFLGGGTPSQLAAGLLHRLITSVPLAPGAEVTVECNPDDVDDGLMGSLVGAGVTRISLGVQSMSERSLSALGRTHDPRAVASAVAAARRAGITSLNLDLIYGAAGESLDEWSTTLRRVLELEPDHVSAYALTVEPGTPLAADARRHPDPDLQADAYLMADEVLTAAGLYWYEISNFARPGHECRHNLLYWRQGDYRGFGCAAHSHVAGRRWWNVRTPERYVAAVAAGGSVVAGDERLDAEAAVVEALQLRLRTRWGIPAGALDVGDDIADLVAPGGDGLVLTRRGRLLANEVALRLRAPSAARGLGPGGPRQRG
ncbi:MAG TPA: radical SAM family heme chaperone HemW [Acidimicrobiales bacterium]|nr:radical SAM family heme chaperone HemW [Acidimicrobiales bacterium]